MKPRRPAPPKPKLSRTRIKLPNVVHTSARHLDVLRVALQLISERGYAGASLRELARRVGVSQPSLYHYFKSKDELVDQIITQLGTSMFTQLAPESMPTHARELPGYVANFVAQLYRDDTYAQFVRFIFLTALEQPRHRAAVRRLYTEQSDQWMRFFLAPYAERGELVLEDAVMLFSLVVRGLGLAFIEERILYANRDAVTLLAPLVDYARRAAEIVIAATTKTAKRQR